MAFRYIYKDNYDFFGRMQHQTFKGVPKEERVKVRTANEIDFFIKKQIDDLYRKHTKIGILLSGGMDSAVLATYLKPGSNAYTFRTNLSNTFDADIERSEKYCRRDDRRGDHDPPGGPVKRLVYRLPSKR